MSQALASDQIPPERGSKALGRPSEYTEALGELVCEATAEGLTVARVAKRCDIAPVTVYAWVRLHPTFAKMYAQARKDGAYLLAEEAMDIADENSRDWVEDEGTGKRFVDHEHIQRSRLRFDARRWYVSKVLPRIFGEKVEVEHTGEVNHTHTMDPQGVVDSIVSLANEQPITIAPMRALLEQALRRLDEAESRLMDRPVIEHQP